MITRKENYNNIPVKYCDKCLSLKIKGLEDSIIEYCDSCGNSDILKTHIYSHMEKYKEMYGKYFITRD